MARDLPRGEAERLIVRGFFGPAPAIELEPVREALGEALEARIRLSSFDYAFAPR